MMIRAIGLLLAVVMAAGTADAGKKKFTHEDAMKFEGMYGKNITNNGRFVTYYSSPSRGDGKLHLHNIESGEYIFFDRATGLRYDEATSVFGFFEGAEAIEEANAEKEKPKKRLKLYFPQGSRFEEVGEAKSFEISNDGSWVIYRDYETNKNPDKKSHKEWGENLTLRHIKSGTEIVVKDVVDYAMDSTSTYLAYSVSGKDESRDGIYYRNMAEAFIPEKAIERDSNALFDKLKWHDGSLTLAYLKAEPDSNGYYDFYALRTWGPGSEAKEVVGADIEKNGEKWHITADTPSFSEDGRRIFYSARPAWRIIHKDDDEEKWSDSTYYDFDKILEERELNVWHWNDPSIVTVEETNWNSTKRESFLGVYNSETVNSYQIADTNHVAPDGLKHSNRYLLMRDYDRYAKHVTWYGWFYDLYLADMETGEIKIIADSLEHKSDISPDGKYATWYREGDWYLYDNEAGTLKNISEGSGIDFRDHTEDRPREAGSQGFMGWEQGSGYPLYYDKHDAYRYVIDSGVWFNLTKGVREHVNQRFRYIDTDDENPWVKTFGPITYGVWDYSAKTESIYHVDGNHDKVISKLEGDYAYTVGDDARFADKIIFTKENYRTFPDIWVTNKSFTDTSRISNMHPYYLEDYNWGTAHQVKWMAQNGDTLYGTYILPDDYTPKKKYPVFIYYYEKFGDRHNQWNQPVVNHRPNYQTYVSDGYIMFLPDIYFREGDPGPSSTESMLDAMAALERAASIDKDKVILHGHSWSGYQSAYIATQTDYFAGVVTGAPVSNMTSAYSGIRLGSGLARQFQYERGQSRIGGNLIDSLDAYIRNSPVFFADKMNTPMLIQFGDIDDAVPYSQGVELYLALRRFEKPAIMLQYEGEPHHLKKYANKLDYLIKMKEFSDYWTGKLEEMPEWMEKGVPYWGD